MTVARIISEKGGEVVTARGDCSLAEIAAILAEKRIGAIVVVDGDTMRGIISERDVVRALARFGSEALRKLASDCMTERVVTCGPDDTINDVMHKMTSGRFRHVPVLKDGRLGGIISIGDVVKKRIEEVENEAAQNREYIATA